MQVASTDHGAESDLLHALLLEAGLCPAPIVISHLVQVLVLASKEAPAKGAVRHDADAKFSAGRDDLRLQGRSVVSCGA